MRSLNGELAAVRADGERVQVGGAFLTVNALVGVEGSTLRAVHNNRGGKSAAARALFDVGGGYMAAMAGA